MKTLLAANFLLGCMLAGAQSERPLPKVAAPSVTVERTGLWRRGGRSQAEFPQGLKPAPFSGAEEAAGKERTPVEFGEEQFAGAKAHFDLAAIKRGLKSPPPSKESFSAAGEAFEGPAEFEPVAISPVPNSGMEFAQGVHIDLSGFFAAMNRPAAEWREDGHSGRYNVKGLLWQSLAFTGFETAYRVGTDNYMRYLIAHGPYWSNYMASMDHWDMTRWSDGDDFIVDEIGHPMQGAVSGFIEIQNGPRQRVLEFGKSKAYWRSRFLALMWATVFSTQQKVGPLGEASLGSAGGYTYVPGCQFPCPSWRPGQTYLNNTGWTDFIMTPVGGTGWVVMEDLLDREVSDRLESRFPNSHAFDNIVRAALNP
ncbi:MAG: hypothetical protein ACRD25_06425, partial [Terracidiphilus sp.]